MARVVMSRVIVLILSSELLGSGSLSLGVEILNLGLAEDTVEERQYVINVAVELCLHVGIAVWGFVDFWVVDDEKDLIESRH